MVISVLLCTKCNDHGNCTDYPRDEGPNNEYSKFAACICEPEYEGIYWSLIISSVIVYLFLTQELFRIHFGPKCLANKINGEQTIIFIVTELVLWSKKHIRCLNIADLQVVWSRNNYFSCTNVFCLHPSICLRNISCFFSNQIFYIDKKIIFILMK